MAHATSSAARRRWKPAFSVDQCWRGLGLGKLLMRAVQDAAAQAGVRELAGMCSACNLRMRRVFEGADMLLMREGEEWHAQRQPTREEPPRPRIPDRRPAASKIKAVWTLYSSTWRSGPANEP